MTVAIVVGVLLVALAVTTCRRLFGNRSGEAEQRYPCDGCLRWPECNGVDEDCPWRAEDDNK